MELDGIDRSGDYLLVSVLNLSSLGPALRLAPHARFDDGELDVVMIRPEDRAAFVAHLRGAALEGDAPLPAFEHHRARHVLLRDSGRWSHVDDDARERPGTIEVEVDPRVVRFVVPPAARPG
jgi:diacylglycerol kinase (ATP)